MNKPIWRDAANAARTTVGMENGRGEPSDKWKKRMLLAEHSPIRLLTYATTLKGIASWVSVHLTRHKIGVEHFVSTQRTDRTGIEREKLPQDSTVNHHISANAQAIINISRKRLCRNASKETTASWRKFLACVNEVDPVLYKCCVPECVYRGFCPEFKSCGYSKSIGFEKILEKYRSV